MKMERKKKDMNAQDRIKAIDLMVAEAVAKRNGNVDAIEEAVIFIEMAAKWDAENKR